MKPDIPTLHKPDILILQRHDQQYACGLLGERAAQLMLVVVFPSSGNALVTRMTLHCPVRIDCMMDVRRLR